MNRYVLFGGMFAYIKGGWLDLIDHNDDIKTLSKKTEGLDWWQIIDLCREQEDRIIMSSIITLLKEDDETPNR